MLSTTDKYGTLIQFSLKNIKAIFYYDSEIHIEYFGEAESIEICFENKKLCVEFSETLMESCNERD